MAAEPGQGAYEGQRAIVGHLPEWDDLTQEQRDLWNAAVTTVEPVPSKVLSTRKLTPWDQRALLRDLAGGEMTNRAIATKFGVSGQYVSHLKKKHASTIAAIRSNMDDQFIGLWIADKAARIAAHQDDYENLKEHAKPGSAEPVKARTGILGAVAEELGQLPGRQQAVIVPVIHIIEGVRTEDLT